MIDYHDFTWPAMPAAKRKKLNVGDIYINGLICNKCDWFIRSRNQHDMVWCKCKACAIDGGSQYIKVTGELKNITMVTVMFEDIGAA